MSKKFSSIMFSVCFILSVFCLSRFILRATGDSHPDLINTISIFLLISFMLGSRRTYFFVILPFSIIISLYAPVGFTYGFLSYQYISSLFATDERETIEFLSMIPYKSYVYSVFIPLSLYFSYYISRRLNLKPIKNKAYVVISAIFLTVSPGALIFINKAKVSVVEFKKSQAELSMYAEKNDWGDVHQTNKTIYDDYILVIGESVRRDYLHVYGYPVNNTPFLDSVNGTIVKGLTAGGVYTIGSLRMMLTQGNTDSWKPHYNMNIMGLVNRAGIDSWWLSNQGQFGEWDTPITSIAKNARNSFFTKLQGYDESNIQDSVLLRKLKRVISKKSDKKRFIVLHTMGSHPDVCDRIEEMSDYFKTYTKINNNIACYISSIRQTDSFLKQTYEIVKNSNKGRAFSIVYFSDHGLTHQKINGEIKLHNNYTSRYHYDIPLVRISSDDKKRNIVSSQKSGLMFVNGLADWMGIEGDKIEPYNLFDGISDKQDFGLSKQVFNVDDPAVDISYDLVSER